jgi:transmembrane sensor
MLKIPDHIIPLVEKYLAGTATPGERDELNKWYHSFNDDEVTVKSLDLLTRAQLEKRIRQRLELTMKDSASASKMIRYRRVAKMAMAAVIIGLLGFGIYWFNLQSTGTNNSETAAAPTQETKSGEIVPGGNKAILTLADGSVIELDSANNGNLASQGNFTVIKLNGQLAYNPSNSALSGVGSEALYNTITTPRGGQYQVILSDGSQVWLNAASSIRFPVVFTGNERRVDITGEVYMEIARNEQQPFKVNTGRSTVEVLGTHFNINAYEDESEIRTTLLEGKVKVRPNNNPAVEKTLTPGQQSAIDHSNNISIINNADLEEAVAWKNGRFQFNSADLKSILRQLARWYDVEVEYRGNTNMHFTGQLTRKENVQKVFEMLQLTGEVHFTVEGRKIIVTP